MEGIVGISSLNPPPLENYSNNWMEVMENKLDLVVLTSMIALPTWNTVWVVQNAESREETSENSTPTGKKIPGVSGLRDQQILYTMPPLLMVTYYLYNQEPKMAD